MAWPKGKKRPFISRVNKVRTGEKRSNFYQNRYYAPPLVRLLLYQKQTYAYIDVKDSITLSTWKNQLKPTLIEKSFVKNKNDKEFFEFDDNMFLGALSTEFYNNYSSGVVIAYIEERLGDVLQDFRKRKRVIHLLQSRLEKDQYTGNKKFYSEYLDLWWKCLRNLEPLKTPDKEKLRELLEEIKQELKNQPAITWRIDYLTRRQGEVEAEIAEESSTFKMQNRPFDTLKKIDEKLIPNNPSLGGDLQFFLQKFTYPLRMFGAFKHFSFYDVFDRMIVIMASDYESEKELKWQAKEQSESKWRQTSLWGNKFPMDYMPIYELSWLYCSLKEVEGK